MINLLENQSSIPNQSTLFKTSPSRYSRLSTRNQQITKKIQKLNSISQSVDILTISKNPLNFIKYEMQGQKSRHDPQMILAKLRKLQNRAEIHRASVELNLLDQQKSKQSSRTKKLINQSTHRPQTKKQSKEIYLKIYQAYLKQKQIQAEHRQRYQDDQIQVRQQEEYDQSRYGIKFFNSLIKHPRIYNFTIARKKEKQGITKKQFQSERKNSLTRSVKHNKVIEEFSQEKLIQRQKQKRIFFQNPQKVIEKQITKFYLRKNPGRLSSDAQKNQRSINLISKQKQICFGIDESRISKEDKKRLRNRFNDLANELARSDRRKSLEGILPKLKQITTVKEINQTKKPNQSISTEFN